VSSARGFELRTLDVFAILGIETCNDGAGHAAGQQARAGANCRASAAAGQGADDCADARADNDGTDAFLRHRIDLPASRLPVAAGLGRATD
jgi:hypothetical protein